MPSGPKACLRRAPAGFLTSGQEEPRTPELGHSLALGASEFVRQRKRYYQYDDAFDRVRSLGGLAGYAHQGVLHNSARGLTLDGLRGKVDLLEILQFCSPKAPLHVDAYYRLLDLGFPLTAIAGSDFPYCGRRPNWNPRIGDVRFYTYLGDDGELDFDAWREGPPRRDGPSSAAGRSSIFRVGDAMPGDSLEVGLRRRRVTIDRASVGPPRAGTAQSTGDRCAQRDDRCDRARCCGADELSVSRSRSKSPPSVASGSPRAPSPGRCSWRTRRPSTSSADGRGFHNPRTRCRMHLASQ